MSLSTAKRLILVIAIAVLSAVEAKSQYILQNPLEWMALAEGSEAINGEVKSETERQMQTAMRQNAIAGEFAMMRNWEKKYNSYLKTASGYASSVKAATTLYHDGIHIFISLCKIKKTISDNPQGIAATMSMNNLYMETATELISVFTSLKEAIAAGGTANMLTGAERSEALWMLQDRVSAFAQRLRTLQMSIRCYTLNDVWQSYTAGMIERDNGTIAKSALRRWKRNANQY